MSSRSMRSSLDSATVVPPIRFLRGPLVRGPIIRHPSSSKEHEAPFGRRQPQLQEACKRSSMSLDPDGWPVDRLSHPTAEEST